MYSVIVPQIIKGKRPKIGENLSEQEAYELQRDFVKSEGIMAWVVYKKH